MSKSTESPPHKKARLQPQAQSEPMSLQKLLAQKIQSEDWGTALSLLKIDPTLSLGDPSELGEPLRKLGSSMSWSSSGDRIDELMAMAHRLIEAGADPMEKGKHEWRAKNSFFKLLFEAGYFEAVDQMVAQKGAQAALAALQEGLSGEDQLKDLLSRGHPEGIKRAIQWGLDPNSSCKGEPWLLRSPNPKIFEAMLKAGADPRVKRSNGEGILDIIARHTKASERSEWMGLAQDALAKAGSMDKNAQFAAIEQIAKSASPREVASACKKAGIAPVDWRDAEDRSLLAVALEHGNWKLVKEMIKWGANPARWVEKAQAPEAALALTDAKDTGKKGGSATQDRLKAEALSALKEKFTWGARWEDQSLPEALMKSPEWGPRLRGGGLRKNLWSYAGLRWFAQSEPSDPVKPMWWRMAKNKASGLAILAMIAREEPFEAQGSTALGALVEADLDHLFPASTDPYASYRWRDSWRYERDSMRALQSAQRQGETRELEYLSPSAIAESIEHIAHAVAAGRGSTSASGIGMDKMGEDLGRMIALRIERIEKRELGEDIGFEPIGRSLKQSIRQCARAGWGVIFIQAMAPMLASACKACPREAGWLIMEALDAGCEEGQMLAKDVWEKIKNQEEPVRLPETHSLLAENLPESFRASAAWREMESRMLSQASGRIPRSTGRRI